MTSCILLYMHMILVTYIVNWRKLLLKQLAFTNPNRFTVNKY